MSLRNTVASIAFILYCLLVFYAPSQFYWRDSGEFSISAYFLDIAHPAGFPLFSQLANVLSFVPFAPIVFRTNIFCLILGLINLALLYLNAYQILESRFKLEKNARQLCAAIPALILLLSPAYLKQSFFPEVYILNALIINILLLLFFKFQSSKDYRYLLLCAFVGALGLGNHVTLGLIILPIIVILIITRQMKFQVFVAGTLLGCIGLLIYLYLPARAQQNPPLNTGNPDSIQRVLSLVSDQRDRELRITPAHTQAPNILENLFHIASVDSKTLTQEISAILVIPALIGLVLLATHNLSLALVIYSISIGNWCFFMGWDAAPWIPMLGCLALGFAFFVTYLPFRKHCVWVIFSVLVILLPYSFFYRAIQIRDFSFASALNKRTMAQLKHNSMLLTEISWFGYKHTQAIDGYRPDLTLIYQPRLLYPDLFEETQLIDEQGKVFTLEKNSNSNFGRFIVYADELYFQPHPITNSKLSGIALLNQDGTQSIKKNLNLKIDEQYIFKSVGFYKDFIQSMSSYTGQILLESRMELEAKLGSSADLLNKVGRKDLAIELLSKTCLTESKTLCTPIILNNLAVYLLDVSAYEQAKRVINIAQDLDQGGLEVRKTLKQNLELISKTQSQKRS